MKMIYLVMIQERMYFSTQVHNIAFSDYEDAKAFCKGMNTEDGYVYENAEAKHTIMPILLKGE